MGFADTVALFGAAVLAAPIGLLGAEFLLGGRPIAGAAFLGVSLALVAGIYYRPTVKGVLADAVLGGEDGPEGRG